MEGIDRIYLINLKRRKDRLDACKKQFEAHTNIDFDKDIIVSSAVDGKELFLTEYINIFVKNNDYNFRAGVLGCALSHYDIWREVAGLSHINRVAIFEDDVQFKSDTEESFSDSWNKIYSEIPDDCDFLYLNKEDGPIDKTKFKCVNNYFTNSFNSGMCTHGYIISKQCAIELVKYVDENKFYCAIDWLMLDFFRNCYNSGNRITYEHTNNESGMKCYRLVNEILYQASAKDSDIRRIEDIITHHKRNVKKKIRVFWILWWPEFSITCNPFTVFLENHFNWEIIPVSFEECKNNPPDVIFSSIYGPFENVLQMFPESNVKKIIYTGECFRGRTDEHINIVDLGFDLSIGFDYCPDVESHIRIPLWYLNIDWFKLRHPEVMKDPDVIPFEWFHREPEKHKNYPKRDNFCLFVSSNDKCEHRNSMFQALHNVKQVDSAGQLFNNIKIPNEGRNNTRRFINKIEYARKYRFQLCPENAKYTGYCTEKILHAFAAGCIPIYWGDDSVIKDFNEKAFINANSKTIEQVITEVMEIENDHEKWQKMVSQPVFNDGVNEKYKNELIRGFSKLF
tara:strand:- start:233 stop:1930 length:1698 start_codon:yes stop_codon:yes gene_type:complete